MRPIFSFEQLVCAMLLQLFIKFEQDTNLKKKRWILVSIILKMPQNMFIKILTYSKLRFVPTEVWNMKQYPIKVCYNHIRRLLLMSIKKYILIQGNCARLSTWQDFIIIDLDQRCERYGNKILKTRSYNKNYNMKQSAKTCNRKERCWSK